MKVNITKYAQISYISINEAEKKDVEKGVLDILNYVDILKNVIIETPININSNTSESQYRNTEKKIPINNQTRELIFQNAPLMSENYFIVPDLIIRKS